jgi:hypothetical protein
MDRSQKRKKPNKIVGHANECLGFDWLDYEHHQTQLELASGGGRSALRSLTAHKI